MSMNTQIDLSKVCGRKVSEEEAARIREVAANLQLRDDDALWPLLAAVEYQKSYYEKIPNRIENASNKLLETVQKAAEKEVAKSQAILAQSVIKHASEFTAVRLIFATAWNVVKLRGENGACLNHR